MSSTCTELESTITFLVQTFYEYAKKGKHGKMNKTEFRKMLSQDFLHVLTNTQDKEAVTKLIHSLDIDGDGKISFTEYWTLVTEVSRLLSLQIARQ